MVTAEQQQQIDELYTLIGRITVKTEHIKEAMFSCALSVLEANGLPQQYGITVLAGKRVEDMRRTFTALSKQHYEENIDAVKIVDEISKKVDNLNRKRNILIHQTWYIGWGNEYTSDYSSSNGHTLKNDLKSGGYKSMGRKTDDFLQLESEMDKVIVLVHRLGTLILAGFNPSKNFHRDSNGTLQPGAPPSPEST